MKIRSNIAAVIAVTLAVSSQVYAEKDIERPPRPSFASLDGNADGEIDFEEFSLHELPHGDHQTVFSDIDSDGDGFISNREFKNHKPPRHPKHS